MTYKHFYCAIIVRLVIIILLSVIITYLFLEEGAITLCVLFTLLLIGSVINIIRYFNGVNKWISSFLLGIENDDTTLRVPSKTGNKVIDDIYTGISRLNEVFKITKTEISSQEQYYRSVIDQSTTGLFSVSEKGRVININPAATKLTKLNYAHHINALLAIDKALPEFITTPKGNLKAQSAIFENQVGQKLLFKLSEIITIKERIKLVAVSDITKELDNREIDSWIKLARTLSHEIMNNIAPITSLSKVLLDYFTNNQQIISKDQVDSVTIKNTVKGLRVIEERSKGLIHFVNNYRKFTKLPEPQFKKVNLSGLIESNLMAASAYQGFDKVKIVKSIPDNIIFPVDEKLLSQVILNLIKNAIEAQMIEDTKEPLINISLLHNNKTVKIEITNNGLPIPPEIREQVFIPFFTTKENGSGIGLSLSKQIIRQMGGDLILNPGKDMKTRFSIVLHSGG